MRSKRVCDSQAGAEGQARRNGINGTIRASGFMPEIPCLTLKGRATASQTNFACVFEYCKIKMTSVRTQGTR